jgi:beta-xylosidase
MAHMQNFVIPVFHPDLCFCRVVGDYCMANSAFEWFQDVTIHHKRLLVNCQLVGYAITRQSQDLGGTHAVTDFDYFAYQPTRS